MNKENPFRECCGCKQLFPKNQLRKGEFEIKKEEAIKENLKIIQTVDNPLVLVEGFFCQECFQEVCGEPEKP